MRPELLKKIMESMHTSQVNLANMNISDNEIQEIMDKIQELNPAASRFDLDNNALGDKGALILKESLLNFTDVRELGLQFNDIGKEGAIYIFSLKCDFPGLDITFHGNRIKNTHEMFDIETLALQKNSFKPG